MRAVCFGSLSCWNTNDPSIPNLAALSLKFAFKMLRWSYLFIVCSMNTRLPTPGAAIHLHTMSDPPPCFTVAVIIPWIKLSIHFSPNFFMSIRAKNIVFTFVRENNRIPEMFVFIFVLFHKLQSFLSVNVVYEWVFTDITTMVASIIQYSTNSLGIAGFTNLVFNLCTHFWCTLLSVHLYLACYTTPLVCLKYFWPPISFLILCISLFFLYFSIIFWIVELLLFVIFPICLWLFFPLCSFIITSFKSCDSSLPRGAEKFKLNYG